MLNRHIFKWSLAQSAYMEPLVFLISDDSGLYVLCPQGLGGEPGLVPVHSRGLRLPVRPTHPDFDPRSAGNASVIASVWVQAETHSVFSFGHFVDLCTMMTRMFVIRLEPESCFTLCCCVCSVSIVFSRHLHS